MILTPQDLKRCAEIQSARAAPVRLIVIEVCEATGVSPAAIYGASRGLKSVAAARDVVCYVARKNGHKLTEIGEALGRDHTSILAAIRREEGRRK
jgi:chromosomal replication initiation ATPase DnaA